MWPYSRRSIWLCLCAIECKIGRAGFKTSNHFGSSSIVLSEMMSYINDNQFSGNDLHSLDFNLLFAAHDAHLLSSSNMLTGSTADSKGRISSINLTTMACTGQAKQTHRLPCACQIFFLIQTRTYDTRLTQCVHHCFHTSSWREVSNAASC